MIHTTGQLLLNSLDRGVLVLTIAQPRLQGEEIAHELREALRLAVEKAGVDRVVIDFRHARYLSSAAFWPLLSLRKQLRETGGRLIICGLNGDVEDVFATTKMISTDGLADAPFEVAADTDAAIARLLGEG
jgi:anti-anti-sigma factor